MTKRSKGGVDDALAGATERVLKQITELYEVGLGGGAPGAMGLKAIAEDPLLGMQMRKPRKKVSAMIIGNHSAGKSSFINWYIGEDVQKTGVAIETRGFTFVTSGKKRETLTGIATVRFFDHLEEFGKIEGMLPNLFTEISTSKDKNFHCVDLIDTPGLVDGDMQYPFNVEDSIVWLADHVDLILVFFDPIGQATCKRTLEIVKRLNEGPHVEKVHYFMSKADAVDKEHDRQRVLIQITQNLATRIRNSHAFNLPTFYLPRDGCDSSIPNAIEEVCVQVDKAINQTVQKNLRRLQDDCTSIIARIEQVFSNDKATRAMNMKKRFEGSCFLILSLLSVVCMVLLTVLAMMPRLCNAFQLDQCQSTQAIGLMKLAPDVQANFNMLLGVLFVFALVAFVMFKFTWKVSRVLTKKEMKKLEEFRTYVEKINEQEKGLYDEYFKTLAHADHR